MYQTKKQKVKKISKYCIILVLLTFLAGIAEAAIKNESIKVLIDQDYSDIWFGISTGGYKLLAEKDSSFSFRIFIKNGMSDRSLHNVEISPNNLLFNVNSITPKSIEQLKPMEIRIFFVNITIPPDIEEGKYPLNFDVSSDEFPRGVFRLDSELKVVRKIRTELYILYIAVIIGILVLLFYRKLQQNKQQ